MHESDEEFLKAKRWALNKLAVRGYFSAELSKKMADHGFPTEIIQRVISDCQQYGYINDKEWLEGSIRSKLARHKGTHAIRYFLAQKGIPKEEIQQAMETVCPENAQQESIQKLLSTKYAKYDLKNPKERQKIVVSLLRRGFSYDLVLSYVK